MIDALIGGKLYSTPEQRTGSNGKPFVTGTLKASDAEGNVHFLNFLAFDSKAQNVLLSLEDGDSVTLAGQMKVGTYTTKSGEIKAKVSVLVGSAMTAYQVTRKRKAHEELENHPSLETLEKLYGPRKQK